MPNRKISIWTTLAAFVLVSCTPPPIATHPTAIVTTPMSRPCRDTTPTSVPVFFASEGSPIVIAAFGTTPAAMVVDTGAEGTVISHNLGSEIGLTGFLKNLNRPFVPSGGIGNSVLYGFNETVPSIRLGNAETRSISIYVLAQSSLPQFFAKEGIDGLLGNDLWAGNNVYLDFPDHNLVLFNQQSCLRPPADWAIARTAQVHFSIVLGYIVLPITIDGYAMTALLDTGAAFSILPAPLMAVKGMKPDNPHPLRQIYVMGVGVPLIFIASRK